MVNNLTATDNISFLLVFLEGLLSFLSPCVIPLIPIYMGYLSGNARQTGEDGRIYYKQKKVFFHTLFFVLGISFAFFLLGISFTALGSFFKEKQMLFTRIGGILILLLGLHQIGLLDFKFLARERKLRFRFGQGTMNPLLALLMGFTFSFAWTPCVGPALASVLLMASGAKSQLLGIFLVFVYTAGFIIPFLLLGLFTAQVLNFLKGHQGILKYTVKVGGALLILIGIMTFTGWMNGISKYLNTFVPPAKSKELNYENQEESKSASSKEEAVTDQGASTSEDKLADNDTEKKNEDIAGSSSGQDSENEARTDKTLAFDFTLTDQYGKEHTLSDYKGKVVFLNFWATWCPPCRKEMPDIEELYKEYGENKEDVIFLGVVNPTSDEYPNNSDVKQEEIVSFLEENGYSFPTVFDVSGDLLSTYYISAFPTTFLIDKEGYIYGYAAGMMTKDVMKSAITQTMESTE